MKKLILILCLLGVTSFAVWYFTNKSPFLPEPLTCKTLNDVIDNMKPEDAAKVLKNYGCLIQKYNLEECIADSHNVDAEIEYATFWKNAIDTTSYSWKQIKDEVDKIKCYDNYLAFYLDNKTVKMKLSKDFIVSPDTTYYSANLFKGIEKKHKITNPNTILTFAKYDKISSVVFKINNSTIVGKPSYYNYSIKPSFVKTYIELTNK